MGSLLYSLLDSMIDVYFPLVDQIGDAVDEVQDAIFAQADRRALQRLSELRRTLLRVRRVLAPEREVVNTLLRRDKPILPVDTTPYFHDLYDHVVRLIDTIDTHRDMLSTATDSYLSVTSNNLNEVMKLMASWSIILMSMTLIAGVYGMNFAVMPELTWPLGYPLALLMMLAVGGLLFVYFRRRNWL
jgi:magnesium transporter